MLRAVAIDYSTIPDKLTSSDFTGITYAQWLSFIPYQRIPRGSTGGDEHAMKVLSGLPFTDLTLIVQSTYQDLFQIRNLTCARFIAKYSYLLFLHLFALNFEREIWHFERALNYETEELEHYKPWIQNK